jgi:DNA topoisomerase-3
VSVQNGQFAAQWIPPEECSDALGRCVNKAYAEQVASQVKGASAVVSKAETKPGKESAPLPFDLTSLQQYASKRWGIPPSRYWMQPKLYTRHTKRQPTLAPIAAICQRAKGRHSDILQALIFSDQNVSGLVAGADSHRKARVFNDSKCPRTTRSFPLRPEQT